MIALRRHTPLPLAPRTPRDPKRYDGPARSKPRNRIQLGHT